MMITKKNIQSVVRKQVNHCKRISIRKGRIDDVLIAITAKRDPALRAKRVPYYRMNEEQMESEMKCTFREIV